MRVAYPQLEYAANVAVETIPSTTTATVPSEHSGKKSAFHWLRRRPPGQSDSATIVESAIPVVVEALSPDDAAAAVDEKPGESPSTSVLDWLATWRAERNGYADLHDPPPTAASSIDCGDRVTPALGATLVDSAPLEPSSADRKSVQKGKKWALRLPWFSKKTTAAPSSKTLEDDAKTVPDSVRQPEEPRCLAEASAEPVADIKQEAPAEQRDCAAFELASPRAELIWNRLEGTSFDDCADETAPPRAPCSTAQSIASLPSLSDLPVGSREHLPSSNRASLAQSPCRSLAHPMTTALSQERFSDGSSSGPHVAVEIEAALSAVRQQRQDIDVSATSSESIDTSVSFDGSDAAVQRALAAMPRRPRPAAGRSGASNLLASVQTLDSVERARISSLLKPVASASAHSVSAGGAGDESAFEPLAPLEKSSDVDSSDVDDWQTLADNVHTDVELNASGTTISLPEAHLFVMPLQQRPESSASDPTDEGAPKLERHVLLGIGDDALKRFVVDVRAFRFFSIKARSYSFEALLSERRLKSATSDVSARHEAGDNRAADEFRRLSAERAQKKPQRPLTAARSSPGESDDDLGYLDAFNAQAF